MGINIQSGNPIRPFCLEHEETSSHLLLHYNFADYNWVGVQSVLREDPKSFYAAYFGGYHYHRTSDRAWKVVRIAIVWALWNHKNEIILEIRGLTKKMCLSCLR